MILAFFSKHMDAWTHLFRVSWRVNVSPDSVAILISRFSECAWDRKLITYLLHTLVSGTLELLPNFLQLIVQCNESQQRIEYLQSIYGKYNAQTNNRSAHASMVKSIDDTANTHKLTLRVGLVFLITWGWTVSCVLLITEERVYTMQSINANKGTIKQRGLPYLVRSSGWQARLWLCREQPALQGWPVRRFSCWLRNKERVKKRATPSSFYSRSGLAPGRRRHAGYSNDVIKERKLTVHATGGSWLDHFQFLVYAAGSDSCGDPWNPTSQYIKVCTLII